MVLLKDLIDDAEAKYGYTSPKRPMSGFYWVSKVKSCTKKGYIFQYTFRKNKEQIRFARVDLRELKWEAKNRGLPWKISNELLARKLVEDEGLDWEEFKDDEV